MDRAAFELMAAAERDHWWFRGRRVFIAAALERVAPPSGARILDVGCGSGGNLALLSRYGRVSAFEYDDAARAVAQSLEIADVSFGALPNDVPFPGTEFDVIGMFDVLEHLEFPIESLSALRDRLATNGALVLTVPAMPSLWGPHDVQSHHFRRYTRSALTAHIEAAGLELQYLSHFNALLLPLAIAQRIRERVAGYSTEALMVQPALNEWLFRVFTFERRWIPSRTLPAGLSLLAIVRHAGA